MNLNETNRLLITEALSDLLLLIQESVPHLSHTSANHINENTLAIASAKIKLEKIKEDKSQSFSLQELKVIYWAVKNLRDETQDFLDSSSCSSSERDDALYSYKAANAVLREVRTEFSQAGIEIEKLFQDQES